MPNFVSEEQIALFNNVYLPGIREDLGRNVTLHIPGPKSRCKNCIWDPINKRSTGMYSPASPFGTTTTHDGNTITAAIPFTGGLCPVCNGTGQNTSEITKIYKCLVRYLKSDQKRYIVQAVEAENDFRLKAHISAEPDFIAARFVEIDGIPAEVKVINRGGLRDISQIIIFLKRSEWPLGKKKDVSRT